MLKLFVFPIFLLSISSLAICQKTERDTSKKKADSSIIKNDLTKSEMLYCRRVETEAKFGEGNAWEEYLLRNINTNIPKISGAPVATY